MAVPMNIDEYPDDNIMVDIPKLSASTEAMSEYVRRFRGLGSKVSHLGTLSANLHNQPHDQARVAALIDYTLCLQEFNGELLDTLIELNTVLGLH